VACRIYSPERRSQLPEEMDVQDWLSEREAAVELGIAVRTLRQWRKKRISPPFAYFGRLPRYHRPTLIEYYKANQIQPQRKAQRA